MHPDTAYAIYRLHPSGDVFAVRYLDNGHGSVTGVCGPLHHTEQDGRGADYDYDTDPENLAEWNALGTDAAPAWADSLTHVRDA